MCSVGYVSTGVVDPDVMLTNNLFKGHRAFDGQRVTFRCVVVGIRIVLTWRSSQYIGTGGDAVSYTHLTLPTNREV